MSLLETFLPFHVKVNFSIQWQLIDQFQLYSDQFRLYSDQFRLNLDQFLLNSYQFRSFLNQFISISNQFRIISTQFISFSNQFRSISNQFRSNLIQFTSISNQFRYVLIKHLIYVVKDLNLLSLVVLYFHFLYHVILEWIEYYNFITVFFSIINSYSLVLKINAVYFPPFVNYNLHTITTLHTFGMILQSQRLCFL